MNSDLSVWLYNHVYCRMIGTLLPAHWFGPRAPEVSDLSPPKTPLQLEIVSHCWQYAHLSVYQLSSLANYPPQNVEVLYTFFYAEEDEGTAKLVATFDQIDIPNVTWNWQPISRDELFRRAIGRNRAAAKTTADWLWYADCDLIFHKGCLDSIPEALQHTATRLAYPATEQITELLEHDHPMVTLSSDNPAIVDIDAEDFSESTITKASGAFQIVHGDVARQCGYCKDLKRYQQPTTRWRKTFEDTAFRRLIEDQGTPVQIKGVHRIRHVAKGRYRDDSAVSAMRTRIHRKVDG